MASTQLTNVVGCGAQHACHGKQRQPASQGHIPGWNVAQPCIALIRKEANTLQPFEH